MVTIRQIRSVVAVAEEGSFTRAAARENATQSGISQHVAAVEGTLQLALFERLSDGVQLTPAGSRYYNHCLHILRHLEAASSDARAAGTSIAGPLRAGLMPTFTRATLPPALERFARDYPEVQPTIIEGYSGALTEMVRADDLDFAIVPGFAGGTGLTVSHLNRSREMLVSNPRLGIPHGAGVVLRDLPPLDIILPTPSNTRRPMLDAYFETHGARINRVLELDAMLGTLELVARSDWVTVLPEVICTTDREGSTRHISPLADPELASDFVVIEPARRSLTPQAQLFLAEIRAEVTAAHM